MPKPKKKPVKKAAPPAKCAGKTKAGKSCPRYAVGRSKYCAIHKKK